MKPAREGFTDAYLKFTHWFSKVQVREETQELRVPEKTIRCIWNDQLFKTKRLLTTDQRDLEIIFPGYWNFGSGPDFKNAAIKVNGETLEGDVELHVYATDWNAHGHSGNPEYNNVILHVFMWKGRGKDPRPRQASIHELELKDNLNQGIIELTEKLDFENYPTLNSFNYGRCHEPLAELPANKLEDLLSAAGDARIFRKMDRFHDRVIANGYEQTFYEGIAEALGYPHNKQPFQILAEQLPLARIKELAPPKETRTDKILRLQALLFGAAGLIEFQTLDSSALLPIDKQYFDKLQRLWEKYRPQLPASPLQAGNWNFGGIRPANYPYRRIAGLAHLIAEHPNGIFGDYIKEFKSLIALWSLKGYTMKTANRLFNFFCIDAEDYWSCHYTPGGKELSPSQQLIGANRSREITVNIVLPIALIYARASRSSEMEAALNTIYQSGKGKTDNKMIRFMKHYIFGNKEAMLSTLSTDKQLQGLMQVYQDFCTQNENNCLRCQFPDVITRYFR